jgi:hypothetical protein
MVKIVAGIKKWEVETTWVDSLDEKDWGAVRHLEHNWHRFRDGSHPPPLSHQSVRPIRDKRKVDQYISPSPP